MNNPFRYYSTSAILSVIGVKRERRRGKLREGLVDANAWLRSALHLLRSCPGPICAQRTVENQSNGKRLRRYRLPLLICLSCFVYSFIRYGTRTHARGAPSRTWLRSRAILTRLAVQIERTNRQFLFKTISGISTKLHVCTQIYRSTDWA